MTRKVLFAAFVFSTLNFAAPALAQTLSYADAVTKLADDCGSDIKKLCRGLNLGSGRIAACLQQNSDRVSPTCKGTIADVFQSITKREHAQTSYEKVCQRDMIKSCGGVEGDGFILNCLIKKKRVSEECSQVLTDAGWR
ncbi:hypothetical protein LJR098_005099 [Rhizobium sp. LjRoot98]|uniref:hypothetical protein n=1 Tax=unclassified Rhizobium TaxID=2613769 RepID=UPI000715C53D|nr:hypothetical protein [Rhizobium sp. Root1204]KQV34859.1 hypothetical protein ASC96_29755 [Rhizobium sp. Root1204]